MSRSTSELFIRGFVVIGVLVTGNSDVKVLAGKAVDTAHNLGKELSDYNCGGKLDSQEVIGAVVDSNSGDVHFFVSKSENAALESIINVVYKDHPEKYVWETGCLLRCELPIKLPIYYPVKSSVDAENIYMRTTEATIAKLKNRQVVYKSFYHNC